MDIQWMMVHWWVLVHCGRVSANIDSIDWVHPQLSHKGHPVDDGALVGVLVHCGRVSANIDSIDWVHPQLSHNGHPSG
jgi:hypothetical protein